MKISKALDDCQVNKTNFGVLGWVDPIDGLLNVTLILASFISNKYFSNKYSKMSSKMLSWVLMKQEASQQLEYTV